MNEQLCTDPSQIKQSEKKKNQKNKLSIVTGRTVGSMYNGQNSTSLNSTGSSQISFLATVDQHHTSSVQSGLYITPLNIYRNAGV